MRLMEPGGHGKSKVNSSFEGSRGTSWWLDRGAEGKEGIKEKYKVNRWKKLRELRDNIWNLALRGSSNVKQSIKNYPQTF